MRFMFNNDNQTPLSSATSQRVEALVGARLGRISDRLTRVEVHVSDVDGPRSGCEDKKCVIELRPNGMRPRSRPLIRLQQWNVLSPLPLTER